MIFLTVGTQLPFDRLVRLLDELAPSLPMEIYAQIGNAPGYLPRNFAYSTHLDAAAFEDSVSRADLIVSHAGIGSILTARKAGKPIVLFPRLAARREHRNDHQLATCRQMATVEGVMVAYDEAELSTQLKDPASYIAPHQGRGADGRIRLEKALRSFILKRPHF